MILGKWVPEAKFNPLGTTCHTCDLRRDGVVMNIMDGDNLNQHVVMTFTLNVYVLGAICRLFSEEVASPPTIIIQGKVTDVFSTRIEYSHGQDQCRDSRLIGIT